MEQVKQKAYAKINLGLDVVRRRADGYHEVKMIMQTVGIYDMITIAKQEQGISLEVDYKGIPSDSNNLVYKAAQLLKDKYRIQEGLKLKLKKAIPVAAGMAGGSADAAAVFRGMNTLFGLGMSARQMREEAVKIGADVPYCISGGTQLSEGIGEILTKLPAPPSCFLTVAKPAVHVSTKFVYQNLRLDAVTSHPDIDGMAQAIKEADLRGITERMGNVLETVTEAKYPVITELKELMKECGALNALMSGSGPTVFGIFESRRQAEAAVLRIREKGLAKQIYVTTMVKSAWEEADER